TDERHELARFDGHVHAPQHMLPGEPLVHVTDLQRHRRTSKVTLRASRRNRVSSTRPTMPMSTMAAMTKLSFPALYESHTKNPMPLEPDIISTATMTIHAIPIALRRPVTIDGSALGISTWRT